MLLTLCLLTEQISARHIELLERRKRDSSIFPAFYWKEKERRRLESKLKASNSQLTKEDVQKVYQDAYEEAYKSFLQNRRQSESLNS